MKPDSVGAVIADDLKQHQWLRLAVKAPQSELGDGESLLFDAAQLAQRAYTVYQSCVYEAMARGESFELAPDLLELRCDGRGEVRFRVDAFEKDRGCYTHLFHQLRKELPNCFHDETDRERPWIQLDPAVEYHLAVRLEPRWFADCGELPVAESLTRFADDSVSEIGKVIVMGVGSIQRVELGFLGCLQWDGNSERVEFTPNGILLEHMRMPQLKHLLEARRSQR